MLITSCTTSSEEVVYLIQNGVGEITTSIVRNSEWEKLYNAFTAELIAFDEKYESKWEWTEKVKNGDTSKSDAAAKEEFEKYASELADIFVKHQKKFDACTESCDPGHYQCIFTLKRIGAGTETLGSKSFKISMGK